MKKKIICLICAGGGVFSNDEMRLLNELKIEKQVFYYPIINDSTLSHSIEKQSSLYSPHSTRVLAYLSWKRSAAAVLLQQVIAAHFLKWVAMQRIILIPKTPRQFKRWSKILCITILCRIPSGLVDISD